MHTHFYLIHPVNDLGDNLGFIRGNGVGNHKAYSPMRRNGRLGDKPKLSLEYLKHLPLIKAPHHVPLVGLEFRKTNNLGHSINITPVV